MIKLDAMPPNLANNTYYFTFGNGSTPSGTMYAIPNSDGSTFKLGFNTLANVPLPANRTTQDFAIGETIMVVMAYTPGASGTGTLSAWINPTAAQIEISAPEPAPTFQDITGGNVASITNIFIRSGANTRPMFFDELRIGKDWAEVTTTQKTLPVSLTDISLSTKANSSLIKWTSKTEVNFDKYVVLFSQNGNDFKEIGSVKGRGNNVQYSFTYTHIGEGFFKLKLLDKDGKFSYTKVLHANSKSVSVKVGPNPVFDQLYVTGLPNEGTNTLKLYNISGSILKFQTGKGSNLVMPLSSLPKGSYVLKIDNDGKALQSTVVIK